MENGNNTEEGQEEEKIFKTEFYKQYSNKSTKTLSKTGKRVWQRKTQKS